MWESDRRSAMEHSERHHVTTFTTLFSIFANIHYRAIPTMSTTPRTVAEQAKNLSEGFLEDVRSATKSLLNFLARNKAFLTISNEADRQPLQLDVQEKAVSNCHFIY